jgi:hypothetical protein
MHPSGGIQKGVCYEKELLGLHFTVYGRTFLSIPDALTYHVLPQISKYIGCVDISHVTTRILNVSDAPLHHFFSIFVVGLIPYRQTTSSQYLTWTRSGNHVFSSCHIYLNVIIYLTFQLMHLLYTL